ncbi:MAG: DegQ family serine endoprotease [Candidatus Tectomicrobia bacterium]|nr:DegQ family serine endoprotease [Candidatus Tectomicrobia bacterium]
MDPTLKSMLHARWRRSRRAPIRTFVVLLLGLFALALPLVSGVGDSQAGASNEPLSRRWVADIVKSQRQAVVGITTQRRASQSQRQFRGPFHRNPSLREFFERFFEEMPRSPRDQRGLGSGFIISRDGFVITNNHVIDEADEIVLTMHDDSEQTAKVVGRDPATDLALVKFEPKAGMELTVAKLGNSDDMEIGDWVVAIGSPFGLFGTVTVGVVSAKGRNIGGGRYADFIQTDAPINPGNSGGPLLNVNGEVIGINTMIIPGGQGNPFGGMPGNIGIGFAVPINQAKSILEDLREKGKVTRGWLGVYIQKVTPELAGEFKLEKPRGALVADVMQGGPAEKAGIKKGDIITDFNGKKIEEMEELPRFVAQTKPGTKVALKYIRDSKPQEANLEVGKLEEDVVAGRAAPALSERLGMNVQDITSDIAESLGLKETQGILVADVESGGAGEKAGMRRGDVILEVNRKSIKSVRDFEAELNAAKGKESVLMLVKRGDSTRFVAVKQGKEKG